MTHPAELLVNKDRSIEWLTGGDSYVCHENYIRDQPELRSFPIPLCGSHALVFKNISGLSAHDLAQHVRESAK